MRGLKPVYAAPNKNLGKAALDEFTKKWVDKYPYVVKSWNEKWDNLSHFYGFTVELRPLIYTTNPIENIHGKLHSVTKKRKIFPNNDAIIKCSYIVVMELEQKWRKSGAELWFDSDRAHSRVWRENREVFIGKIQMVKNTLNQFQLNYLQCPVLY